MLIIESGLLRQLCSNPDTPLKQALRMKFFCSLGNRTGCPWAKAATIRQLCKKNSFFDYVFSNMDTVPVDAGIHPTEEDNRRFFVWKEGNAKQYTPEFNISLLSVEDLIHNPNALHQYVEAIVHYTEQEQSEPVKSGWEAESAILQCKTEYDLAPQSVKALLDDSNILDEYAEELAYFSSIFSRKHHESAKTACDRLRSMYPNIDCDRFLEVTSYLGYLLPQKNTNTTRVMRFAHRRENIGLNVLAILNRVSLLSNDEKSIENTLADWLVYRGDYSITTCIQVSAVMGWPFKKVYSIFRQVAKKYAP